SHDHRPTRPASSADRNDSRSEDEGDARSQTGVSAASPLSCASGTFTSTVRQFYLIRSGGSGRAGNAAFRRRGDRACEFFLRVRLSQTLARGLQARGLQAAFLVACTRVTSRTITADLFTWYCLPRGWFTSPADSDFQAQGSGRRTGIAVPIRPTVCQKPIAQPPLPVSLYKPLVFRRFRAGARWRSAASAAGFRADG